MKIGLIARADEAGLARMSIDYCRHVAVAKSLVVVPGPEWTAIMPQHLDQIASPYTVCRGNPSDKIFQNFLIGLDIVIAIETPYNWNLFNIARNMGIYSVLVPMYENLVFPLPSRPDLLISTVDWHLQELRATGLPTIHLPWPVDTDLFAFQRRTKAVRFLSVVGNWQTAPFDRNGVHTLAAAIPLVVNRNVRFIIRSRQPLPGFDDPRIVLDEEPKANAVDNWRDGDVFLYPRRFAGQSLPMLEALSCGMPVLMPDMDPQNKILPADWLFAPDKIEPLNVLNRIDITTVDPQKLALAIDAIAEHDITADSKQAREIAESLSWKKWQKSWSIFRKEPA